MSTPEAKPKTLVQKLCEAGAAVGWIEKGGYNEFHKYKYATEADIVSTLRGELFKRHVFIFPNVTRHERKVIEVETMKWDDDAKRKVPSVRKTALTEVDIEWSFTDGESGEVIKVMVPGVGEDSVDKGLYKAFTGSEKYLLMKSFLLPTGDDPERDSKEEEETARQTGRQAAQEVGRGKVAAAQGKTGKLPEKAVNAIFYTEPPSQNGHFIEFLNLREFVMAKPDLEQTILLLFSNSKGKRTKDGTTLVPSENVPSLLETLAGDHGLTVKKLEAPANA